MQHCYDFYKPDMATEYPVVDGKLSLKRYFTALDKCYQLYKNSFGLKCKSSHDKPLITDFDYMLFHTPFCKMVQKAFGRMMIHDLLALGEDIDENAQQRYKELLGYRYVVCYCIQYFF